MVTSTYEAALQLNHLKIEYGLLRAKEGQIIEIRIKEAIRLMHRIDDILLIKNEQVRENEMNRLGARFSSLNNSTICKKKELRWPVASIRFNFPRIIWAALTRN